jgi:hypothetical protein
MKLATYLAIGNSWHADLGLNNEYDCRVTITAVDLSYPLTKLEFLISCSRSQNPDGYVYVFIGRPLAEHRQLLKATDTRTM